MFIKVDWCSCNKKHQTPAFMMCLTLVLITDWNGSSYTPLGPSFTGEASLGAWGAGDLAFCTGGFTAG